MKPKMRALEVVPLEHNGEECLLLRDRMGFSPDAVLPRDLGPLLALFNGRRTVAEIFAEYERIGGEALPLWFQEKLLRELDELLLLDSPHFQTMRGDTLREFADETLRAAAFSGLSYPDEAQELGALLDGFFGKAARLPLNNTQTPPGCLRGIVVPHIDFTRGGPVEALAYQPLFDQSFDVLVVLGIAHCGVRYPFCATAKDYETPLGLCRTDAEFVAALQERIGARLTEEQFAHKNEHSIEFVAVFLQHIATLKHTRIVPILCGGFHDETRSGASPDSNPDIHSFITALREVTAQWEAQGQRVGFIASVDGAHVGSQFGDDTPLTPSRLKEIEQADREFFACAESGDAEALHQAMARDQNARHVDAHPALYTLLKAFPLRGQLLHYAQAYNAEANIVVSFAAMTLHEA